MPTLVLLRHGQSLWNLEQRFTGWVDIDLTDEGEAEAVRAGELIKATDIPLDRCFCSVLTRAIRTADLALAAADQLWIPLEKSWRLNERHYGGLTGRTHAEVAAEVGDEQVRLWRRSYDIPPPPLKPGGRYDFAADRRYAGEPIPVTESLKAKSTQTGDQAMNAVPGGFPAEPANAEAVYTTGPGQAVEYNYVRQGTYAEDYAQQQVQQVPVQGLTVTGAGAPGYTPQAAQQGASNNPT